MGKLMYFPIYGRAEPSRMILNHAGVKFEDSHVQMADWGKVKPTVPGNTLPIWVEEDGTMLGESAAICQALARKHGFAPQGFLGEWANSYVFDITNDCNLEGFRPKLFGAVDEESVKKWVEAQHKLNAAIERHLTVTDMKFCAGDNLTASDFWLITFYTDIPLNKNCAKNV